MGKMHSVLRAHYQLQHSSISRPSRTIVATYFFASSSEYLPSVSAAFARAALTPAGILFEDLSGFQTLASNAGAEHDATTYPEI